MNGNHKFGIFYVAVVSVALVGSLYANHLNSWNHVVFTFPPETQKVVNGTATMEIQWRWLPETLEIIVTVNDDETNITYITTWENQTYYSTFSDGVCFLFDSDNNGRFSNYTTWQTENDHCVTISTKPDNNHTSAVTEHCWLQENRIVRGPPVWCPYLYIIAYLDNSTSYCFKQDKGYTFNISIPIELIKVRSPTNIVINFWDGDSRKYSEDVEPFTLVAELRV